MSGVVRRPGGAHRPRAVAQVVAAMGLVLTAGCGSVGQPDPYDPTGIDGLEVPSPSPDPVDFVDGTTNQWLAWAPGQVRRYTVSSAAGEIGTMTVEVGLRPLEVAGVEALVVTERVEVDGEEPEETTGFFAQDRAGNVWWLGGESDAGSWRAGEDGVPAGLLLPAEPRLGDGWVAAPPTSDTRETTVRVLGRSDVVTPASQWPDALETAHEVDTEADTEQRRYYAFGEGLVRVVDDEAGLEMDLVEESTDQRAG